MTTMELVRSRRSVRTFDGRPLSDDEKEALLGYAQARENLFDLPITWRILSAAENGLSSPVIAGTDTYIAGKMRRAPHAEEAFGCAFEEIVLYAQSMGIGTTWIAGTMNRPAFERAMGLADGEVMPCVSPLGHPAAKMSLRETLMRKGIRADARLPFGELFFDGDFSRPLTPAAAGRAADALEMVRWAPSAVNKQPWRVVLRDNAAHFYEKKVRGYTDASGWDIQKIDMGIALCHFALGLAGSAPRLTCADPGLPVPEDTVYIATYLMN